MTHGIARGPEGRLVVHRTAPISQLGDLNTLLFRFLLDKKICELGYVLDTDPVAFDTRCMLNITI